MTNFQNAIIEIAKAIHNQTNYNGLKLQVFSPSNVKYIRVRGTDKAIYRVVEQNKNKNSRFANMARKGHAICWLLKEDGMVLDYTGSGVVDNVFVEDMHGLP